MNSLRYYLATEFGTRYALAALGVLCLVGAGRLRLLIRRQLRQPRDEPNASARRTLAASPGSCRASAARVEFEAGGASC